MTHERAVITCRGEIIHRSSTRCVVESGFAEIPDLNLKHADAVSSSRVKRTQNNRPWGPELLGMKRKNPTRKVRL